MKLLFDIFPVVLFFAAFKLYDIFVATAVAIVASFVQIGWMWFRHRKIEKMMWVSLVVITVFGGATLLFKDDTFIKWKPTVLYWLFGGALAVGALAFKKNLLRSVMGEQLSLPEPIWQKLLASWIGFFIVMGVLNLYVAYNFSLDTWVDFKMFGGIGLMLLFVIAQGLFLAKHVQDQNT